MKALKGLIRPLVSLELSQATLRRARAKEPSAEKTCSATKQCDVLEKMSKQIQRERTEGCFFVLVRSIP